MTIKLFVVLIQLAVTGPNGPVKLPILASPFAYSDHDACMRSAAELARKLNNADAVVGCSSVELRGDGA